MDAAQERAPEGTSAGRKTRLQLGFNGLQSVHPDDLERVGADWTASITTGQPFHSEYRIRRHDGSYRWFDVRATALRDSDGKVTKWFGSNTDIDDRKRAQELHLRTQKMESLGTLAGGIAHDFNNILLAIRGNTKLALEDLPARSQAHESLMEIDKASARAADLVRRILAFSRQEEPKSELVELQPVIEEAMQLLRSTLPAMIELRSEFSAAVPPTIADATQIHQIIMNLATNSAHAIGDRGGVITISLDVVQVDAEVAHATPGLHEGRYSRLSVTDDGSGMVQCAAVQRPAPATANGGRVLYVDDDEALVSLAGRTLKRLGYNFIGCDDPVAALDLFRSRPLDFDVVVSDLSMPQLHGFDLARELLAVRSDVPIVITSGYVRREDQDEAERLGVAALILKPNTIEELGGTLDQLFRQRQANC